MKFVIENMDKIVSDEVCTYVDALKPAYQLFINIQDLENYASEMGKITADMIDTITIYGDDYPNEFYIKFNRPVNPKGSVRAGSEDQIYLEILKASDAERNEIEYMNDNVSFTAEDRQNYKLGETVQWYKPLGDSGYWYTLR